MTRPKTFHRAVPGGAEALPRGYARRARLPRRRAVGDRFALKQRDVTQYRLRATRSTFRYRAPRMTFRGSFWQTVGCHCRVWSPEGRSLLPRNGHSVARQTFYGPEVPPAVRWRHRCAVLHRIPGKMEGSFEQSERCHMHRDMASYLLISRQRSNLSPDVNAYGLSQCGSKPWWSPVCGSLLGCIHRRSRITALFAGDAPRDLLADRGLRHCDSGDLLRVHLH